MDNKSKTADAGSEEIDYLSMSDEEFDSFNPESDTVDIEDTKDNKSETSDDDNLDESQDTDTEDEDEDNQGDSQETTDDDEEEDDDESETDDESSDNEDDDGQDDDSEDSKQSDFEKEILSPFKANGREMQVSNAEEAITLMKQGANYNKKMLEIKPALGIVKALTNKKMLNDETINYLIDLHEGKPEAVKKLLKESKFDLMEYEDDEDINYTPSDNIEPEESTEVDEVMGSLSQKDTYPTLIKALESFDDKTIDEFYNSPELLRTLEENISSGEFARIDKIIATQQALGKLKGVSYLEAYEKYAEEFAKADEFKETETKKKMLTATERKAKIRNSKKSITSKTKQKKAPVSKQADDEEIDFMSMSDEDFEKFSAKFA